MKTLHSTAIPPCNNPNFEDLNDLSSPRNQSNITAEKIQKAIDLAEYFKNNDQNHTYSIDYSKQRKERIEFPVPKAQQEDLKIENNSQVAVLAKENEGFPAPKPTQWEEKPLSIPLESSLSIEENDETTSSMPVEGIRRRSERIVKIKSPDGLSLKSYPPSQVPLRDLKAHRSTSREPFTEESQSTPAPDILHRDRPNAKELLEIHRKKLRNWAFKLHLL